VSDRLSIHADLDDLDLTLRESILVRWYRAMILTHFYNPVKVRSFADRITAVLEETTDE